MAIPQETVIQDTMTVSTERFRRRRLQDQIYNSGPVFSFMRRQKSVKTEGGLDIRIPFIHTDFSDGGSFGDGDTFASSVTDFASELVFDWKWNYKKANTSGIQLAKNRGPLRTFSIIDATLSNAALSLIKELSRQTFADGTGNSSKDIDGLGNAISRSTSVPYGKVTRTTTGIGSVIRAAVENTDGGALSLSAINSDIGAATIGNRKPNLGVFTQALKDKIWDRTQPTERNVPEDIRKIGFIDVMINGMAVAVDSFQTSGVYDILTTSSWTLYSLRGFDFRLRGPFETGEHMNIMRQYIFAGNLVCDEPRAQGKRTGVV